jgi:hypothetical protein
VNARRALVSIALACAGSPVLAADGVVEINQSCALAGCFAGDAAGFPVEIDGTAGASYRLTSDLVVSDANLSAIRLVGPQRGVTLDLGGFAIRGPIVCSGVPATCPGTTIGLGIDASDPSVSDVAVRNGIVRGMGAIGVHLGDDCAVDSLRLLGNRLDGLRGGDGCRVGRTTASGNGEAGVTLGARCRVAEVIAYGNQTEGIVGSDGCEVRTSLARANGNEGVNVSVGAAVIEHVLASDNGNAGISCAEACALRGCVAYQNSGAGVIAAQGSTLSASVARGNAAYGLDVTGASPDAVYADSSFTQNGVGAVRGGTPRAGNHCSGPGVASATCP